MQTRAHTSIHNEVCASIRLSPGEPEMAWDDDFANMHITKIAPFLGVDPVLPIESAKVATFHSKTF